MTGLWWGKVNTRKTIQLQLENDEHGIRLNLFSLIGTGTSPLSIVIRILASRYIKNVLEFVLYAIRSSNICCTR